MSQQADGRGVIHTSDCTGSIAPGQVWYPSLLVDTPIILPPFENLLTDPFGCCHPVLVAGKLQLAREQLRAGEEAAHLILSAWSSSTNTAYQSAWARWERWCRQRDLDPYACDVKFFLDFLASLFEQELQHKTINTISQPSVMHEGVPLGQHPLVTRLMRGIFKQETTAAQIFIHLGGDQSRLLPPLQ